VSFAITSGENAELQFSLFDLPSGDTWKGEWEVGTSYVVADVVYLGGTAYENILAASGSGQSPSNPTYWTALSSGILATDIKAALVELVDSSRKVKVSWSYAIRGDVLTSGTLTIGARYRIAEFNGPDDFTNVGAIANITGETFEATGTTPTSWGASSQVQEIVAASNVFVEDGSIQVELLAGDTVNLSGAFEIRISVSKLDTDYIGSGAQTQVFCLEDAIVITTC